MPNITLDLRLTGLCAFVPNKASINTANNQVRVLLVDAGAYGGHNHEPHYPVLVFDYLSHDSNYRAPDLTFYDGKNVKKGLCFLDDIEVSIAGSASNQLEIIDDATKGVDCPNPDGTEDHYFSWVLRMENACPGSGTLENGCLAEYKVNRSVAARVRLTQGSLQVLGLALETATTPIEVLSWRCGPVGGCLDKRRQAIAEEVKYEFLLGGEYVEIEMKSLSRYHDDVATSQTPLRLAPNKDQRVHAAIMNMPLEDILGRRRRPHMGQLRGPDSHFEHFYALSSYDPGRQHRPVPHPAGYCPRKSAPDVANPKCPPVQFEPDGDA